MIHRKLGVAAASVALVALEMCGCSTSTNSSVHSQHLSKATFTGVWPLTVDSGTIACDVSKGGSITFAPDGTNDVYAENGTAMGDWAKQNGWKDFHDIWMTSDGPGPRVNAGDLDAVGQKLCDEGYGHAAESSPTTTTVAAPAAEAQTLPPNLEAPLRGFMSKPPLWDRTFGPATAEQCYASGFHGFTPASAWQLPGGALACAGNPAMGAWDGRVVTVTLLFDPPVDAQTALQRAAAIFPTDAQPSVIVPGHNSEASPDQTGTCGSAVYTSAALGSAVRAVLPTWTGQASKATLTLYSGGNTDGSDSVFNSDAVRQVSMGLHDTGPDPNVC